MHRLIDLDVLYEGIRFAMMENLMIQFVYSDVPLPDEYEVAIESIDHFNIKRAGKNTDVCVVDDWDLSSVNVDVPVVLRTTMDEFVSKVDELERFILQVKRINVVFTDIEFFTDTKIDAYCSALEKICTVLEQCYVEGNTPQLNLLTDRMVLQQMNNCGAGETNITLAPNGRFYVCPAFYYEDEADSIGDLKHGLDIKNKQLYRLDHAPICRHCDAWQCKRCVWLNRKTTLEVNTPSHEQCVLAHLERNVSRKLLNNIRKYGLFFSEQKEIREIDYLDPFDKRDEWL